jgi:carotenoid 1,2-hydratase
VFSPYYALARKRSGTDKADPLDYCSLNVSLYGTNGSDKRWTMTERDHHAVSRSANSLRIGPSALHWDGANRTLTVQIDEVTVPWPSRVHGKIVVHTPPLIQTTFDLDREGRHHWRPLAPSARIEVLLERPGRRWEGAAYVDSNFGDAPLEDSFESWNWCRAILADGGNVVLYDGKRRDGTAFLMGRVFDTRGSMAPFEVPSRSKLPTSAWRLPRSTFGEGDSVPSVVSSLEDGPFYARALVTSRLRGESTIAFHETLSLDRFRSLWIQPLLMFRMPRRTGTPTT